MRGTWWLLVVLVVGVPAVSAQSLADRLDQSREISRAQVAIGQDDVVRGYNVLVQRRGDQIVLTGRVPNNEVRQRAVAVVRDVLRDAPIQNQIEVTSEARRTPGPLPPRVRPEAPPAATEQAQQAERPAPQQQEAVYHTVRRGDTLIAIARQHNTSVAEIQRLNNIRGTNIRAGQRLRVR